MARAVIVGSRGSPLALRQAEAVIAALKESNPDKEFAIKVIKTRGDSSSPAPWEGWQKGVFVRELEAALMRGEIDLAVHSLKDMPTEETPGLEIAAIPPREDPRDVLVASSPFESLPPGSRLGTGSPRRTAQLSALRPDLSFLPIRGNIDTRLRKVASGEVEGAVMAAAGLHRLGLKDRITQYFPPEVCLPAVGQGALAVQIRQGDPEIKPLALPLDHPPSRREVVAERAFLHALGGGCRVPIAALAKADGSSLALYGLVASPDGHRIVRREERGEASAAEEIGERLADKLLSMGARELLG